MGIKIVIVEDNPMLRENLELMLGGEPGFTVTASFATGEETLQELDSIPHDLLLADIGLPGMSGIDLISQIKTERPDLDILVHTVFDNRDTVFSALKAGASGYILKGATPRELVEAIRGLAAGGAPMSPKIARAVINEFQDNTVDEPFLLTSREKEILKGMEQGYTYKELGKILFISPHTIHSHIKKFTKNSTPKTEKTPSQKLEKKGLFKKIVCGEPS